jgi:hypothetical protein
MKERKHRITGRSLTARDPLLLGVLVLLSAGTLVAVAVAAGSGPSGRQASSTTHATTVVTAGPTPTTGKDTTHAIQPKGTATHPSSPPPLVPLAVPDITNAAPGTKSTTVSWTDAGGTGPTAITGYNVYVATKPGGQGGTPVNAKALVTTTSYVVDGLATGVVYYFTVKASNGRRLSSPSNEVSAVPGANLAATGGLATPVVGIASSPDGGGYWLTNYLGAVGAHGAVASLGSNAGVKLNSPICQIVATADGKGYWEVARDGGVFTFGDAAYFGSVQADKLNAPIVGMAATKDSNGYWVVARDGGVFAFGDAAFYGSMAGQKLNRAASGIAADPATGGYWVIAADGGVFAFNAPFFGTAKGHIGSGSVVAIAATSDGGGYFEVSDAGGVFAFGSAGFHGSWSGSTLPAPVTGMAIDASTGGYWLLAYNGAVAPFGAPTYGSG